MRGAGAETGRAALAKNGDGVVAGIERDVICVRVDAPGKAGRNCIKRSVGRLRGVAEVVARISGDRPGTSCIDRGHGGGQAQFQRIGPNRCVAHRSRGNGRQHGKRGGIRLAQDGNCIVACCLPYKIDYA